MVPASGAAPLVLMVLAPGQPPRTIPLPASGRLVFGRGGDADVQIADGSLSRAHAAIHVGPTLLLEDLGSANGTRIQPGLLGQLDQDDRTAKAGELERTLTPGERVVVLPGTTFRIGAVTVAVQRGATTSTSGARASEPPTPSPTSVPPPSQIIADEPAMVELFAMAERAARRELPVLIVGETGTGKEVLAETVWRASARAGRPLLRLNCGALASSLLESELFGYQRGAFTGADRDKPGLIESADGGTVFLDEIGDAALEVQTKLLRVLDQGEVMRPGALEPKRVDVRFLAATHRDLDAMVVAGTFRADFFYRISSVTLQIPPLRERRREIARLEVALKKEQQACFTLRAERVAWRHKEQEMLEECDELRAGAASVGRLLGGDAEATAFETLTVLSHALRGEDLSFELSHAVQVLALKLWGERGGKG